MDMTPAHIITVLCIFTGFHLLALPLFVWAVRHRQFSGPEQKLWSLEEAPETTAAPPAHLPVNSRRARWMVGTLGTLAVAMRSTEPRRRPVIRPRALARSNFR